MIKLKYGDVVRIHPEIVNPGGKVDEKNISRSKKSHTLSVGSIIRQEKMAALY